MLDMEIELGIENMAPTPQIAASAPFRDCPKCGRRMQVLATNETSWTYVCYSHSLQNADTTEPFYLNIHHKFMDENGRVRTKEERDAKAR